MSDRSNLPAEPRLEAYLDSQMAGSEREAFEASLRSDPMLREQVELQSKIDAALIDRFPTEQPSSTHLAQLAARMSANQTPYPRTLPRWAIGIAAAAAIAGVLLVWRPAGNGRLEPVFQPQPVAQIYAQAVESGFSPYYECDEPERFAAVFDRRQGQPLKLLPLPEGVEMLGVSYPGGLSRDSTAMLCRVEGRPVMVLVDRAAADRIDALRNSDPALHIFREERDGLVFYEVTPFEEARVTEFLALAQPRAKKP